MLRHPCSLSGRISLTVVRWRQGGDTRSLAGKPVRLRFVLRDADLYAFQFVPYQPDPERPDVTELGVPPAKK